MKKARERRKGGTAVPDEDALCDLADLFKIFGDTTRIRILYALMGGERCVNCLADTLRMTQSAISHQLRVLKDCNLVETRRNGKQICYSLADDHVSTIIGQGYEHLSEKTKKGTKE
jgi:DNA-binding transcriptional ArsR family regulator